MTNHYRFITKFEENKAVDIIQYYYDLSRYEILNVKSSISMICDYIHDDNHISMYKAIESDDLEQVVKYHRRVAKEYAYRIAITCSAYNGALDKGHHIRLAKITKAFNFGNLYLKNHNRKPKYL